MIKFSKKKDMSKENQDFALESPPTEGTRDKRSKFIQQGLIEPRMIVFPRFSRRKKFFL